MRVLKIASATLAAVIAIAALLLMVGVPSGFLTSAIKTRVERETGYRLTISGATTIGLWPQLNVILNDVSIDGPGNRDGGSRLSAGRVQADMTLASLWSGRPDITELVITRPVLSVPLLRERSGKPSPSATPAATSGETEATALAIGRVTVADGTVVFSNPRDRVDRRIEGINADVAIGGDRKINITGNARAGEQPLKFEIKATAPAPPMQRQNIPAEFTLDASGSSQAPLSAKAEVRLNGSIVMINGLTGTLGDGAFNGWASVDLASKPLVKLDLDFQRLAVAGPSARGASTSQGSLPWSNASIDLTGLNYVDAEVKISAAELNIGDTYFAPAAIEAALAGGVLKAQLSNLGAYEGQANGELVVDVSAGDPAYTLRSDLTGVRALPLLRSAADFDKLDGRLQAKIGVRSSGNSQHAIMSNLDGTVFAVFQDGAIRGLNLARMIRSLSSGTLSGWQQGRDETTDLSQLSASFRIEKGRATTGDLNLVGPLVKMTGTGTVDLAAKSLAFRVEPKLVMTTEGQGRASDPVGLGIPVVIDGPWAEPRIYPDMAGILDNPDAAYARLKEMGKGLFGTNNGGLGGSGSSSGGGPSDALGDTLGKLIEQGLRKGGLVLSNPTPSSPAQPPSSAPAQADPAPSPDSQPMKDVLRQLFNR
jgi:AsmA protein